MGIGKTIPRGRKSQFHPAGSISPSRTLVMHGTRLPLGNVQLAFCRILRIIDRDRRSVRCSMGELLRERLPLPLNFPTRPPSSGLPTPPRSRPPQWTDRGAGRRTIVSFHSQSLPVRLPCRPRRHAQLRDKTLKSATWQC
jgi:hypothetical protein